MATITLSDPRPPMEAGKEILRDVLQGRDVVAGSTALVHALYDAAELIGGKWERLADRAAAWQASEGDPVCTDDLAQVRRELLRATEAADAIIEATLTESG